eukprot:605000-Alexandrium_andersonii.AAC.1
MTWTAQPGARDTQNLDALPSSCISASFVVAGRTCATGRAPLESRASLATGLEPTATVAASTAL